MLIVPHCFLTFCHAKCSKLSENVSETWHAKHTELFENVRLIYQIVSKLSDLYRA